MTETATQLHPVIIATTQSMNEALRQLWKHFVKDKNTIQPGELAEKVKAGLQAEGYDVKLISYIAGNATHKQIIQPSQAAFALQYPGQEIQSYTLEDFIRTA